MCSNPRVLSQPSSDWSQLRAAPSSWSYRQARLFKAGLSKYSPQLLSSQLPYHNDLRVVPCGKCIECLRQRQHDLSTRVAREADKRGSFIFLTLTYREDMLPIACSLLSVDTSTGDTFIEQKFQVCRRYQLRRDRIGYKSLLQHLKINELKIRSSLESVPLSSSPRYSFSEAPFPHERDSEGFKYMYQFTPSICRKDVRLWLKAARVAYEREYGRKLPDFSYVVIGEFGPRTCRPHYHLGFFGLSENEVLFMAQRWYKQYGAYNCKVVSRVNPDNTSGFSIAAKYIGKYMSKGKFECESVRSCFAERPRLCMSKNFGAQLSENLISYYRCYDLYGKYDINTLCLENGKYLTDSQLKILSKEILKRDTITVDGFDFSLPSCYKHKLWYYEDYDLKGTKVHRASTIRRLVSDALSQQYVARNFRKLERFRGKLDSGEGLKDFTKFFACSENFNAITEKSYESALSAFYSNSIF